MVSSAETFTSPLAVAQQAEAAEKLLRNNLADIVGGLAIEDFARMAKPPQQGQHYPAVPLSEYSLWPIIGNIDERSTHPVGYENYIQLPNGIQKKSRCYMDAGMGIALVYEKREIAYAAAGVSTRATICTAQFQATHWAMFEEYRAALYGGMRWTDTLALAWEEVGKKLGLPTAEIVPADASGWWGVSKDLDVSLRIKHDRTANRLGYKPDETGMWRRDLATPVRPG